MSLIRRAFTPLGHLVLAVAGSALARLCAGIGEDNSSEDDE